MAKDEGNLMRTGKYISWREEKAWLGYLEEFPNFWTPEVSLEDLMEHLKNLHDGLQAVKFPFSEEYGGVEPQARPTIFNELVGLA